MHPTTIDADYMRRVAAEAARYDVDSFEICGAFANPAGGLNGLLLFEPYPQAAAKCDRELIMRTRKTLQEIVDTVVAANQKSVDDYKGGKTNALGFLVGQCMKASKGKGNPALMREMLLKYLEG